jgi:transposase
MSPDLETAMTVAITGMDLSAADLSQAAARTQNGKTARRMLVVAHVLEGCSRTAAAQSCAMDRQTLRDWVHRYNANGLEGLSDLPRRNGPEPRLSVEQQAAVADWVEQGADLARDDVAGLVTEALPTEAVGKPVEVWFADEAPVGQQGTLTRIWAKRGTRPRAPRDRGFKPAYLFGAVCPERCAGAAIVMPRSTSKR